MGIMVAIGIPMPDGIIEGIVIGGMDMGICMAGFMVTSWLDNERYGEYNRQHVSRSRRFGMSPPSLPARME